MMIRPALIVLVAAFIAACGGGSDSTTQIQTPTDQPTGQQVGLGFINTTGESIDFFVKEISSESLLFDEINKVVTSSDEQVGQYSHSWSTPTPLDVDIGALDTNTQSDLGTIEVRDMNSGENYWLIAWPDIELGETVLFAGRQEQQSIDDRYAVRVFSLQDIELKQIIFATGTEITLTATKGNLTPQIILDSCVGELFIDHQAVVDFCGPNVTTGNSYLLIIKDNSVLLAAEEK